MRIWLFVLVGLLAVIIAAAAIGGRDNSGEEVRTAAWADDVCGAASAWQGQLEAIGDQVSLSNVGARRNDGGSGDHVEGVLYVRSAVDRAIDATDQTLQQGLVRVGYPDTAHGRQASLVLVNWAQDTENALIAARQSMKDDPNTTAASFAALGRAVSALERSAVEGRAAFARVAALDPALADAFDGSRTCRDLTEEQR